MSTSDEERIAGTIKWFGEDSETARLLLALKARAEVAEKRVKELEAEVAELEAEIEKTNYEYRNTEPL